MLLTWRAEEGVTVQYDSIIAKLYTSAFRELNSELNYLLFIVILVFQSSILPGLT